MYPYQANRQEVVRVNGQNGANAYMLPPNSSILLLDETAPIIWLKTTDGAGYPTLTPYKIEPYVEKNPLEERIARLEELVYEQQSNATKSNSRQKSADDKRN